jgi:hypothetical protein
MPSRVVNEYGMLQTDSYLCSKSSGSHCGPARSWRGDRQREGGQQSDAANKGEQIEVPAGTE